MDQETPTTSIGNVNKRRDLAQSIIQRALKAPEQDGFVFKNLIKFRTVKGHILPSLCHHEENTKCQVCEFEKGLELPSLPDMIFADNLLELYVPMDSERPFIQFNAYDALKLVDPITLPAFMVKSSETWQKAREQTLPKIPFPFDWTYTSNYAGTLADGVRIESTNDEINLEKLMRRDPILFYASFSLYEDELDDNGGVEMTMKVRVMSTNYFVLCRFYLRVDGVIVRVYDCRLYGEEGWKYLLRECTKREANFDDIPKEHHKLINDSTQIWQHLPVLEQKTDKIYYPQ